MHREDLNGHTPISYPLLNSTPIQIQN
jgi:hypothetical protein